MDLQKVSEIDMIDELNRRKRLREEQQEAKKEKFLAKVSQLFSEYFDQPFIAYGITKSGQDVVFDFSSD